MSPRRLVHKYIDPKTNDLAPLISDETYDIIQKHGDLLNSTVIYDREYYFDYFGFKTLERSYLLKTITTKLCAFLIEYLLQINLSL